MRELRDAMRLAAEATTYSELVEAAAPAVRALDVHTWFAYCVQGELVGLGGRNCDELYSRYNADGFARIDPHMAIKRERNPRIMISSRMIDRRQLRRHAVNNDFYRRFGIEHQLSWRASDVSHFEPGMFGLQLFRFRAQRDFTDQDARVLRHAMPAFAAAARRLARAATDRATADVLEAVLVEVDPRPRLALDLHGRLLWASPRAEPLLSERGAGHVPAALIAASRSLARDEKVQFAVELPAARAELALARSASGTTFVLVELDDCDGVAHAPRIQRIARRYRLTRAETEVFALLAVGLANRDIARRRHTSLETVKTHVGRILGKLGVASRTQAAVMARGNHSLE